MALTSAISAMANGHFVPIRWEARLKALHFWRGCAAAKIAEGIFYHKGTKTP